MRAIFLYLQFVIIKYKMPERIVTLKNKGMGENLTSEGHNGWVAIFFPQNRWWRDAHETDNNKWKIDDANQVSIANPHDKGWKGIIPSHHRFESNTNLHRWNHKDKQAMNWFYMPGTQWIVPKKNTDLCWTAVDRAEGDGKGTDGTSSVFLEKCSLTNERQVWQPNGEPSDPTLCATGKVPKEQCTERFFGKTLANDNLMKTYCKLDENKKKDICSCLYPDPELAKAFKAPTACWSAKCRQYGYKLKGMEHQEGNCPSILVCNQKLSLEGSENVVLNDVKLDSSCTNTTETQESKLESNSSSTYKEQNGVASQFLKGNQTTTPNNQKAGATAANSNQQPGAGTTAFAGLTTTQLAMAGGAVALLVFMMRSRKSAPAAPAPAAPIFL